MNTLDTTCICNLQSSANYVVKIFLNNCTTILVGIAN